MGLYLETLKGELTESCSYKNFFQKTLLVNASYIISSILEIEALDAFCFSYTKGEKKI